MSILIDENEIITSDSDEVIEKLLETGGDESKELVGNSHSATLKRRLWAVADLLRGQMDASEYPRYMLGLVFYKYLCERFEIGAREHLELDDDVPTSEVWEELNDNKDEALEYFGYFIAEEHLYSSIIEEIHKGSKGKWNVDYLATAFNELEQSAIGSESEEVFKGLFNDVDLTSDKLGEEIADRNKLMANVILEVGKIDFYLHDAEIDVLGDAYEYLIGEFASDAGKKGGEFYTPQSVSNLISRLISHENANMKSIYDPTCGSGSMLLQALKTQKGRNINLYGQELNSTTYNLARMNMIMHGKSWDEFELRRGNTLENDRFADKKFDAIAANPPYSSKWEHTPELQVDPRFSPASKLAPKDKADFAFVQHCWHHLDENNGFASIVLPHGVLFRSGAEGVIRKWLLEQNAIHAIIGLPEKLFFGTGIATVILVLKKERKDDDGILFVDGSKNFTKGKNQNKLDEANVNTLLNTYKARKDVSKLARLVDMDEVAENEFNLNIARYVDSSEDEVIINLDEVEKSLSALYSEKESLDKTIADYISQLHPVEESE